MPSSYIKEISILKTALKYGMMVTEQKQRRVRLWIKNLNLKDMEEVIHIQAVRNPVALELAREVKKTVAPNEFVNETLNRKGELLQVQNYFKRQAEKVAKSAKATGMEEMIITAFQTNAPAEVIEAMKKNAGITDIRLAELKKQAQAK